MKRIIRNIFAKFVAEITCVVKVVYSLLTFLRGSHQGHLDNRVVQYNFTRPSIQKLCRFFCVSILVPVKLTVQYVVHDLLSTMTATLLVTVRLCPSCVHAKEQTIFTGQCHDY